MTTQLTFALNDIKNKPFSFALSFIQILAVLLMIATSCLILSNTFEYKNKFEIFDDTSKMYFLRDDTKEEYFQNLWENKNNSHDKVYSLYKFITNNKNFISYSFNSDITTLNTNKPLNTVYENYDELGAVYKTLKVNENFTKFFKLKCVEGKMFSSSDYKGNNQKNPIILGYDYKKYYKIGDEIMTDCIVTGFLAKDSFYLDPKSCGDVLSLDNTILFPMVINKQSDFQELDVAIFSTTIVCNNHKNLASIQEKSNALKLYDISFKNYTKQLEDIISNEIKSASLLLIIASVVLFFCTVCLISFLLNFIESHKREFAVHMLCGATKVDFIHRIIWQIAMVVLIGDIIVLCVFKISFAFFCTLLLSLLLLIVICALPIIKISKQSVNELLKRSE